jgi:MSHA biogenesis protein MshI
MRWLGKGQKQPGWLALGMHPDHVDLVHVRRTANRKPEVLMCDTFRREGSYTETLTRLRKELKLDLYRCTTLLKNEDYQMHQVEAPKVPAAEMKTAIRWRVKDVIDYPLEGATIDVLDIPVDDSASARNHQVYAVTARNSAVEAYVKLFNDADLPLEAIDIPDLAQRNIAALFEPEGRGVAMVAFYEKEGMLTFTRDGELYLARRIDITLAQLGDPDLDRRNQYFERVALELQRSLDHFDRQYHYVPVSKLLLAPLPPGISLHEYLVPIVSIPVETIDLATVLEFPLIPELKHPERQSQCMAAIGAALRDEVAA